MQFKFFSESKKNGNTKTSESYNSGKFKNFIQHSSILYLKNNKIERITRRIIAVTTKIVCIFVLRFIEKMMPKARNASPAMPMMSASMSPPVRHLEEKNLRLKVR